MKTPTERNNMNLYNVAPGTVLADTGCSARYEADGYNNRGDLIGRRLYSTGKVGRPQVIVQVEYLDEQADTLAVAS